jgi:phage tail tape-measure protein
LTPETYGGYIESMSRKTIIMMGMIVGSCAGGYAATLFGADAISFGSLLGSTVGGILGIWAGFRFSG